MRNFKVVIETFESKKRCIRFFDTLEEAKEFVTKKLEAINSTRYVTITENIMNDKGLMLEQHTTYYYEW